MDIIETAYHQAAQTVPGAVKSQMFGKPCYKTGGKAFVSLFDDCMVFKLSGDTHAYAIALAGARRFDPSGKGRPMKEWVQLPYQHHQLWAQLAQAAAAYVASR